MDSQQVCVLLENQCKEKSLFCPSAVNGGALALLMDLKAVYCPITIDHKQLVGLTLVIYGMMFVGLVVSHNTIHLLPKYRQ